MLIDPFWISNEGLLSVAIIASLYIRYVIHSCCYHLYYLSTSTTFRRKRKKSIPFFQRIRLGMFLSYYEPCVKYHIQLYRKLKRINSINWGLFLGLLLSYLSACILSDMRIVLVVFFHLMSLLGLGMMFFFAINVRRRKKGGGVEWVFDSPNHKR